MIRTVCLFLRNILEQRLFQEHMEKSGPANSRRKDVRCVQKCCRTCTEQLRLPRDRTSVADMSFFFIYQPCYLSSKKQTSSSDQAQYSNFEFLTVATLSMIVGIHDIMLALPSLLNH